MTVRAFIAIALLMAWAIPASGYEVGTHRKMADFAAQGSVLNDSSTLERFGLQGVGLDDKRQTFPNSDTILGFATSEQLTISKLIQFGSAFEDDRRKVQALYHFFNPVNGQGLIVGGSMPGAPSPNWALEDNADFGVDQPFSYKKGRQYFYDALTKPAKADRDKNWGLTFQTLGHVIHHLQDMAQPQHVRNDLHCDALICAFPGYFINLYSPSLFEKWTLDHPPASALFGVYTPVYSETDAGVFTTPRKFWTTTEGNGTGGKGVAEYTSRGFFSSGTLFSTTAYPSPTINILQNQMRDVATVCAEAEVNGRPKCPAGLSGKITFFSNTVTDSLRTDETRNNLQASSLSVFDADLKKIGSSMVFALNRFNFDAAHEFIIPRAVAYSAGLLNYFFRGKLEISLPEEGVYGIVDHNHEAGNSKTTGGFGEIRLKLRNVTAAPGGGVEPMSGAGKLRAVARFHRNACYEPDLSGEYGSPGKDWNACRANVEEIVVSDEVTAPAGINDAAQPLRFVFQTRVPISATDLHLQVVYRGPLGEGRAGAAGHRAIGVRT